MTDTLSLSDWIIWILFEVGALVIFAYFVIDCFKNGFTPEKISGNPKNKV
jgi:hypothetical protein